MHSEFNDLHLRGFSTDSFNDKDEVGFLGSLPALLRSVREIIGKDVDFVRLGGKLPDDTSLIYPIETNPGKVVGYLVLRTDELDEIRSLGGQLLSDESFESKNNHLTRLLKSIADVLGETYRWQLGVRNCQIALAAREVPLPLEYSICGLQKTLKRQLKILCVALKCDAASLYMLSEDTSHLSLRAIHGLPEERLLDPPRRLSDSYTDMEAMLGQAVLVNETYLHDFWKVPEPFPSAICVPVNIPSSILGTLWIFSNTPSKSFENNDMQIIELVVGRIAAELQLQLLRTKRSS